MRILHVNDHLAAAGGIETYLMSLMPLLQAQGHAQACVYAKGGDGWVGDAFQLPELSMSNGAARRSALRKLTQLIAEWRPDVVHLHNVYNIGAVDACLNEVPTVVTGHDFRYVCPASSMYYRRTEEICERQCGPGCFTTTVTKRCLTPRPLTAVRHYHRVRLMAQNWDRFAHLITPSRAAEARFLQAGFPRERATVLPNFCPLQPRDEPRPLPESPTIMFLGRISAVKGYRYFIEALGLLPGIVSGVLIGNVNTQTEREIRECAQSCGCADRLEVRPWAQRDEIAATICRASVVCFPSVCAETLGVVGLEALACGVPVVASDVGGVREWLLPGETGLLVPPKDPQAIAAAVLQILDHRELARAMGDAGLKLIRERFSPECHLRQLLEIYNEAAENGSPTTPLGVSADLGHPQSLTSIS